jgi:hypothetical protein
VHAEYGKPVSLHFGHIAADVGKIIALALRFFKMERRDGIF